MKDERYLKKTLGIGEQVLFVLNVFIVFLLFFESRLAIPSWLQVAGRMHPLILHFPIVLLLLTPIVYGLSHSSRNSYGLKMLALSGAITASLTVVMGIFLSREQGYSGGDDIALHKWLGVAVSVFATFLFYQISYGLLQKAILFSAPLMLIALTGAGHFGAVLTHGEDFLFAPLNQSATQRNTPLEEALVFDHLVEPIFKEKCASCHSKSKSKGRLDLSTPESITKGGKTGKLLVEGKPEESLLLKRIFLPEENKKHMPPKNKTQLTDAEIGILEQWVRKGSPFEGKIADLPAGDTLKLLALQKFETTTEDDYDFPFADEDVIEKLNSEYRVVFPLAEDSPALFVNIYNSSKYSVKQLEELLPIRQQIVSLDLSKMPVQDRDLNVISEFGNLRKLNLNGTTISGSSLAVLTKLKNLKSIALSSTSVKSSDLKSLSSLKNLKTIFAWNTSIGDQEREQIKQDLSHVVLETGFKPDHTKILRLTPPKIDNETRIYARPFSIAISHPVKEVTFRYTLDNSEPDSINGQVYSKPIPVSDAVTTIKVRAYKEGWYGSELTGVSFYKTTYRPDSIRLLTPPNKKYFPSNGGMALMDLEAGDYNYASYGGWLGFNDNPMILDVEFAKAVDLQEIVLSTRYDLGAYIFPPRIIQIYGGESRDKLALLQEFKPLQPSDYKSSRDPGIKCTFKTARCKYLKIVAEPVPRLPAWHSGKGDKAWIMVDEILFN